MLVSESRPSAETVRVLTIATNGTALPLSSSISPTVKSKVGGCGHDHWCSQCMLTYSFCELQFLLSRPSRSLHAFALLTRSAFHFFDFVYFRVIFVWYPSSLRSFVSIRSASPILAPFRPVSSVPLYYIFFSSSVRSFTHFVFFVFLFPDPPPNIWCRRAPRALMGRSA